MSAPPHTPSSTLYVISTTLSGPFTSDNYFRDRPANQNGRPKRRSPSAPAASHRQDPERGGLNRASPALKARATEIAGAACSRVKGNPTGAWQTSSQRKG